MRAHALGLALLLLGVALHGQVLPDRKKPEDPYTGGQPEAMAAAGIVSFGPFPLTPHYRTEQVDAVVGVERLLWIETAHFKIGCGLDALPFPQQTDEKKWLAKDLKRLRKKLPKVKARLRLLDRWLRAHLYAMRLEELYEEFRAAAGFAAQAPGKVLNCKQKLVFMLFQKKSNMARFFARFCEQSSEEPMRTYDSKVPLMVYVGAAEGFDGFLERDITMWCYCAHNAVHIMIDACNGFMYDLPMWFEEGVAHWFVRKIDPHFTSVNAADTLGLDYRTVWNWPPKVRARVGHDYFPKADQLLKWGFGDEVKYTDHMFMWSHLDYLLRDDPERIGKFMAGLRGVAIREDGVDKKELLSRQDRMLREVFGVDHEAFDRDWVLWVLKNYPKK